MLKNIAKNDTYMYDRYAKFLFNNRKIGKSLAAALISEILNIDEKLLNRLYKGDKLMKEVKEEAKRISDNIDWDKLYYNQEEIDRLNREEAIKEGYQEGIQKGMAKGMEKGIEEGVFRTKKDLIKK